MYLSKKNLAITFPSVAINNMAIRNVKSLFSFFIALGFSLSAFAQNPIVNENTLSGNPSSEWDVSGAGDPTIQGFATQMSVNKGSTINFKINVTGSNKNFTIKIYRIGYYQGNGARLISNLGTFTGVTQPSPSINAAVGLVDCGNWSQSASWAVPSGAVSGVYIARLTRSDNGGASHIIFVVRDDASSANILVKTSDATWQAYNTYGGYGFYEGSTANTGGRADKISYNRPFSTRNISMQNYFFLAEYPMIRWLERNGYDMAYTTDVDMERNSTTMTPSSHKILLSNGHDEYWSANERNTFENARGAGVNLAFFSGNEVYWKVRYENNERTLVCYKEGNGSQGEFTCGGNCDPLTGVWTGLWRFGCEYGEDGCKPENALTGQLSWTESQQAIQVPYAYKDLSFWRNTSVATLSPGQTATLGANTLGYEWSYEQPAFASSNPPGRITLSSTTVGDKTHKLSLYTHSSGALVFGSGTVQWAWGLDDVHDLERPAVSRDMQQATLNLFLDMGVSPATPQSNLILSGGSGDLVPPVSVISSPANGLSTPANTPITISGTASDASGITRVEVSVNGGSSWQTATGTTSWNFNWTPTAGGSVVIKSRAIDNNGNVESPGNAPSTNAITITVTGGSSSACPCSIFTNQIPANANDRDNTTGIVVGTRFSANTNGTVTALRFYKGAGNTGTHIGQLWSSSGTLLAQATFTNETTSGWQQVTLPSPVSITAGTSYIVSYHSSAGYYSNSNSFFTSSLVNGPLTASADVSGSNNGLYKYSTTPVFPDQSFGSSNYFTDVVFNNTVSADLTPPTVTSTTPAANATAVATSTTVTAVFSESLTASTVNGTTVFLQNGTTAIPATVSYTAGSFNVVLTPTTALTASTNYTVTLKGGASGIKDVAGNALVNDYIWSFTTSALSIARRGTTVSGTSTSASLIIAKPTGVVQGDILIVNIATNGNNIPATSAGWSLLSSSALGGSSTRYATILYKIAGASEAANYTFALGSGATGSSGSILAFSGVDVNNPFDATFGNISSTTSTAVSATSITTSTANSAVIFLGQAIGTSGGTSITWTNSAYKTATSPGALTELFDKQQTTLRISVSAAWAMKTTAGATGAGSATITTSAANGGLLIALRRAGSIDVIPPTVVSTTPAGNATGVATNASITAIFNESLTASTVNGTNVFLNNGPTVVPANVSYTTGSQNVVLTPSAALTNGVTYTATLKGGTGGIKDVAGNSLATDYIWSFTTVPVDLTPPTVVSTTPTANATGVATNANVTAVFSESLTASTMNGTNVFLNNGATTVPANVSYTAGSQNVVLTPTTTLNASTTYTVTLKGGSSGIKDAVGNPLATDYTWSFTTSAPDAIEPVSNISIPTNGASVPVNQAVSISGTASDAGGLNRVEVSVNGGTSWQTATGTSSWSFSWTPTSTGPFTIKSRGIDNAGNTEVPGSGTGVNSITVNVVAVTNPCPCTIFSTSQTVQPTSSTLKNDGSGLAIGAKFSANTNGYITGLRFYKASGNSGTHTGQLYSLTGTLLAQAVFTNETASGWQQVNLTAPVAITANTVYVVSYHSSAGGYNITSNYFTSAVVNGPLRGLANGENGGNGIYIYSATPAFPNATFQASNYWVDAVFNTVIPAAVNNSTAEMILTDTKVMNATATNLSKNKLSFFLAQNSPNPSNGRTVIRYTVPFKTHVSMGLFDIQGRQIRLLVNEIKNAGEQQFELDTRTLNKGVYYYKIKADGFTGLKRMVVE